VGKSVNACLRSAWKKIRQIQKEAQNQWKQHLNQLIANAHCTKDKKHKQLILGLK